MKVIYSLQEFHDRVCKITGEDPRYVRVKVELGMFHKIEFECYTDGLRTIYEGKTMEECLTNVQNAVSPPPQDTASIDVEIEIPDTEIAANA